MSTTQTETSEIQDFTEQFINETNCSVFLTGKAGTGKTTLLRRIKESTHKRTVIVAPTGIAALNAGGVTIHSFFQLPFAGFIPEFGVPPQFMDKVKLETRDSLRRHFGMNKERINLIRSVELLIIDEVSMLRADLLDAIDWTLRNVTRKNEPFGGVQVLFIGDLLQLPPVVKQQEWSVLRNYYAGIYFFNAQVMRESPPVYIELEKVFRQQDNSFVSILNNLRNNRLTREDVDRLNAHVRPDFNALSNPDYITLTTHNAKADEMNARALEKLDEKEYGFASEITGDFPPHLYPLDETLKLRKGARVMFIKNDSSPEKRFYNGKTGIVSAVSYGGVSVHFPDESKTIEVEKYEWENIRYSHNDASGEINEEVLGTFVQYPLKLAWAITIHKSQGLTFDKAVLDVSRIFAPGQAYVALSRLRSLDGLVLKSPFSLNGINNEQQVVQYADNRASRDLLEETYRNSRHEYLRTYLQNAFDWYEDTMDWQTHASTYKSAASRSEKGKNHAWFSLQLQKLTGLSEPASKFRRQIDRIFSAQQPDMPFLKERVDAAYEYFFAPLDQLCTAMLKKSAELGRKRTTQTYAGELGELAQTLIDVILAIKRARIFTEAFSNGRTPSKELFSVPEILHYRLSRLEKIKNELRQEAPLLIGDEDAETLIPTLKKGKRSAKKEPKRSTYEKTLELVNEGLSAEEIAAKRQLSSGTVFSHLTKLVRDEKLELKDVLSEERIALLKDLFDNADGDALTPLKEKAGEEISWEELKLYRAYLLR